MFRLLFTSCAFALLLCGNLLANDDFILDNNTAFSTEEVASGKEFLLIDNDTSPFYKLGISDEDRKLISKLIKTLGETGLVKLLFKRKSVEAIGDQVYHVHPMRFLGYIFANPKHMEHMRQIHKSHFKWSNFVDGLSDRLKGEMRRNNVLQYVDGFAKELGEDPEILADYLIHHKWEGFLLYLMR